MRKTAKLISTTVAITALLGSLACVSTGSAIAGEKKLTPVQKGKKLTFNRKKGNCISCHAIAGGVMPGNLAPPLIGIKARFPDKAKLRAKVWDATKTNPNTAMPPFGRHKILPESDIDNIVEYVYTL